MNGWEQVPQPRPGGTRPPAVSAGAAAALPGGTSASDLWSARGLRFGRSAKWQANHPDASPLQDPGVLAGGSGTSVRLRSE